MPFKKKVEKKVEKKVDFDESVDVLQDDNLKDSVITCESPCVKEE